MNPMPMIPQLRSLAEWLEREGHRLANLPDPEGATADDMVTTAIQHRLGHAYQDIAEYIRTTYGDGVVWPDDDRERRRLAHAYELGRAVVDAEEHGYDGPYNLPSVERLLFDYGADKWSSPNPYGLADR